jgi:hypothetical protein
MAGRRRRAAGTRREPVKRQHEGKRQIIGKLCGGIRRKTLGVEHRLRQPGPDIDLPPRPRALQPVEAEPRHDGDEEGLGVPDILRSGVAKIGVLHDVLGIAAAAEHAIGKAEQPPAMRRERIVAMRPA